MLFNFLSEFAVLAQSLETQSQSGFFLPIPNDSPWRPAEWSQPVLTAITVPGTAGPGTQNTAQDILGNALPSAPAYPGTQTQVLVFDAVLRVEHHRELRKTEHPIQTSASSPVFAITDHAYRLPTRVTLEIGMSDGMDSYSNDLWTSAPSKSVSAYQTLASLMDNRTIVQLTTRLESFPSMLVESIRPTDTHKTRYGLRATVTLSEVFFADVTAVSSSFIPQSPDDVTNADSARPQNTSTSTLGNVQSRLVTPAVQLQHQVTPLLLTSVPGAGKWSSSNTNALGGLIP